MLTLLLRLTLMLSLRFFHFSLLRLCSVFFRATWTFHIPYIDERLELNGDGRYKEPVPKWGKSTVTGEWHAMNARHVIHELENDMRQTQEDRFQKHEEALKKVF